MGPSAQPPATAIRSPLSRVWSSYITGGLDDDPQSPRLRRVKFINLFGLITVVAMTLFGLVNLLTRSPGASSLSGYVELGASAAGFALLLATRLTGFVALGENGVLLLAMSVMTYLLITGGMAKSGAYWWFTLPAAFFYLKGVRRGWIWIAANLAILGTLAFLQLAGLLATAYSGLELRQFAAAYAVVSMLMWSYQHLREQHETLIERQTAAVLESNRRLQEEVEERERAQRAMEAARQEAESANRAKSEFLSRMSHELRTPLNAILGFSQLLATDTAEPLTEGQRESVEQILTSGDHLLGLINEVLDLARIEAGRMTLHVGNVDARSLAAEAAALLRPLAEARKIILRDNLAAGHPVWVQADTGRLRQVLLNLLSNGIKYNREEGQVLLDAEIRDGRVLLHVTDTGPGIPPEDQARIFEPFQRLGQERGAVEGTGIGLTIVAKLVALMGGEMHLVSTPGVGTRFSVELSAGVPDADGPSASEDADGAPGDAARLGTILYVEDDLANLALVRHILKRRPGVGLLHALRGYEGIALARTHRPDLVLLDIHLPDIRGEEVFRILREDPATCAIPVVAVSASVLPPDVERIRASGVDHYLTKPLDITVFLETVDAYLGPPSRGETS